MSEISQDRLILLLFELISDCLFRFFCIGSSYEFAGRYQRLGGMYCLFTMS